MILRPSTSVAPTISHPGPSHTPAAPPALDLSAEAPEDESKDSCSLSLTHSSSKHSSGLSSFLGGIDKMIDPAASSVEKGIGSVASAAGALWASAASIGSHELHAAGQALGLLGSSESMNRPNPTTPKPIVAKSLPDPGVSLSGDRGHQHYTTIATGANLRKGQAFPLETSTSLNGKYKSRGYALTELPSWAVDSNAEAKQDHSRSPAFWAPEIHKVGQGYVMYFSARDKDTGQLAIGSASSASADGPFKASSQPLVAYKQGQDVAGDGSYKGSMGAIDPTMLSADGKSYLYWKEDGNGCKPPQPTRIMVQQLNADGTGLEQGSRPQFTGVVANQKWEGAPTNGKGQVDGEAGSHDITEAPELMKHGKYYYMFFSGNLYSGSGYGEGVSRSTSPTGPFTQDPSGPILKSGNGLDGPGHVSLTTDGDGNTYMVYAAHPENNNGSIDKADGRQLYLGRVEFSQEGWPQMAGGDEPSRLSKADQPVPLNQPGAPAQLSD